MQDNSNLSVKTFDVGPMQNIVYLIWNNKTKEGAIIDPAWDLNAVLMFIKNNHIKLTSILLTHSHHDHVNSIDRLLEIYDVPIYINKLEAEFWNKTYDNLIRLDSQAEIFLGEKHLQSIHTPGHTPGSISFYFEEYKTLIAGDTLFQGSIGRTDLPGGNFDQIVTSIKERIYSLDDDAVVVTGHGPNTSIGYEKMANGFVRA